MIAAIYCRKSRFTEKGDSIENQISLCEEYGKSIGVKEFIKYEDEGFSGGNTDRPQFQALLKDAENRKFEVLICYRLDRISRNLSDFIRTIEILRKNNISFISIREQFDTTSPMGRAMMNIAAVFAELERETTAERIKDNMQELAKSGRWLGGTAPLGYRSEPVELKDLKNKTRKSYRLIEVPEEIELVNLIYNLFWENKSYFKTVNYLCKNNYKGKNGGEFSRQTVKQIISNPVYCIADDTIFNFFKEKGAIVCGTPQGEGLGLMVYNKRLRGKYDKSYDNWIISIGQHKGIIESNKWLKCNSLNSTSPKANSHKSSRGEKFMLSGLILCGKCGSSLSTWSHYNNKTSRMERYYRCSLKQKASSRCNSKMLNANYAEELILNSIKEIDSSLIIENLKAHKEKSSASLFLYSNIELLERQQEKNNKIIQGLIRKLALLEDDLDIIKIFKTQIYSLQEKNIEIENKIKNIGDDPALEHSSTLDIIQLGAAIHDFKLLSSFFTHQEIRNIISKAINTIVWNSDERSLEIFWQNSE
jgi:site-specific DNA recombinase